MSYQIVETNRACGAVETLCRALGVSAKWLLCLARTPTQPTLQRDADILVAIHEIYQASRGLYGSPRIHAALRQAGSPTNAAGRITLTSLSQTACTHPRQSASASGGTQLAPP